MSHWLNAASSTLSPGHGDSRSRTVSHLISTAYGWSVAHEPTSDHRSTLYGASSLLWLLWSPWRAGASPAITGGEGKPGKRVRRARACSRIGRCVAVTGALERLVLGDATHGAGDRVAIHISGTGQLHRDELVVRRHVLPCALGRRITAALAAGQDRETLPAVTAVDAAAQPTDQMQTRASTVGSGPGKTAGQPS